VQAWTFPIENTLMSHTESIFSFLKSSGAGMTADKFSRSLKDYSDFCASYAFGNYTKGSATAVPWTYVNH